MKKNNLRWSRIRRMPANTIIHNPMDSQKTVMMKTVLSFIIILCFAGCKKDSLEQESAAVQSKGLNSVSAITDDYHWIAATNNANNRIEVYDVINYPDWNSAGVIKWSWMPSTGFGYTSSEVSLWTNGDPEGDPMDVKLRYSTYWSGSTEVVVAVGGQLVTVCRYAGGTRGQKLWSANVGAGTYPHAAEILPDGNVVVATSHGNFVRIYNTTAGATNYATYTLDKAHGVLWDPLNDCLWAIGSTQIVKYIVGGSKTSPTLSVARITTIPGNGHDLSMVEGDSTKLWYTNSNNVYKYDKATGTSTLAPGAANRTAVKAISNQPIGQIVETRPNTACTLNTWCTATVDFYAANGTYQTSRTRTGAAFYKADVWIQKYQ